MDCCKTFINKHCFICSKVVNKKLPFVSCIRCGIHMHNNCYESNKTSDKYTQCNNCQKIGTLGIPIRFVKSIYQSY